MGKDKKWKAKHVPQEVLDSAHRIWLAGLGAMARAEEEGGRFFRNLVERGEEVEGKGRERVRTATEGVRGKAEEVRHGAKSRGKQVVDDVARLVDERVDDVLHRLGVPSRQEIERLTSHVEELNRRIEGMNAAAAAPPAAKPKPAAKPAPKPAAKPAPKPAPKPTPKPPASASETAAVTAGKGTAARKTGAKSGGAGKAGTGGSGTKPGGREL
jgi:poly(hydroxyalkanoate) granule-associated protein